MVKRLPLRIMTGATLTINAGVEVRFPQGGALLVEEGKLDVKGSAAQNVLFTADTGRPPPRLLAWALFRLQGYG